jgi:hypothetical protein
MLQSTNVNDQPYGAEWKGIGMLEINEVLDQSTHQIVKLARYIKVDQSFGSNVPSVSKAYAKI